MGRPLREAGRISNLNSDIVRGTEIIRRRAGYQARNNPLIVAASNALVTNIVGPGIRPVSQHPSKAMRKRLHELWSRFVDTADADGALDFYGMQGLLVRNMIELGEGLARFRPRKPWDDLPVPLQIQTLHPSMMPIDTVPYGAGVNVRAGIEFDQLGRRVAYHILRERLDDPFTIGTDLTPARVIADDVIHLYDATVEPGLLRGLSWLNPVIALANDLDKLQVAALKRAEVSSMLIGAVTDPNGQGANLDGEEEDGSLGVRMTPGTFINLDGGQKVEFLDPAEFKTYGEFVKVNQRLISAALGIPYEILSNDLSGVNYSSIRTGVIEFQKRLAHWQFNVVVFKLCRPVWDRFIKAAVLAGEIPAGQYAKKPEAFHKVEFLPPKQAWVDPLKDAQAAKAMIDAGLTSRRMVVAELGYDLETIDADREMDKALDPAPAAAPDQQTDAEDPANE